MIRYRWTIIILILFAATSALAPSAAGQPTAAFQGQAALDVPFFSQTALRDQRAGSAAALALGNSNLPLWERGCGVASLAMVYRHYGVDTDVVRLNGALRQAGAFSGALLAWDRAEALCQVGAPWIQGIERVDTARPRDYQKRVDQELAAGRPLLAYLGNRHYVVLVGKDKKGNYLINDPWKLTAAEGQGIALEQNDLKLKFDDIRQFVFIYPERNAPTNGVPVSGAIADKYFALGGASGSLGNPQGPAGATADGGQYQTFERGAILAVQGGVYALQGPVWEKYLAEGLSRQTTTPADTERPQLAPGGRVVLGWPRGDSYSYFVGKAVEWRADFAHGSIVWTEGERPQKARVLTDQNAIRGEYFANPDLSGTPAYTRYEEALLFDWREGAPGPWVKPDGFSARYTATIRVGGLGWWYNFVVDADEGVRVKVDGETALEAWAGGGTHRFTRRLGRGEHTLVVEYREGSGEAHLRAAWSAWPAQPAFAAEGEAGPYEWLPASAAESVPDLATPSISEAFSAPSTPTPVSPRAAMPTSTPGYAELMATIQAFQTRVAALSTALVQAQSQLTGTPVPAASSLVGKWEYLSGDGDCFGMVPLSSIEFFPDETYTALIEFFVSQPVGGRYTILPGDRLRFEFPQAGLIVCDYTLQEDSLLLTGSNLKPLRYVRYREFPPQDYPQAIIGKWGHVSGYDNECFEPFKVSTPDELLLYPDGTFVVRNWQSWYGGYSVSGNALLMESPSVRPTPTVPPGPSEETTLDVLEDLLRTLFGGTSDEPPKPFDGRAACQIERITQAQLILSDGAGNYAVYHRSMTREDMIQAARATATAIALIPPTPTPTPTPTATPTPPLLSIIAFDYQAKDVGEGWKEGTVRLAFENTSDRPLPAQCLIFQQKKEESSWWWSESSCTQVHQVVITDLYIETREGKTYPAEPSRAEVMLGAVGGDPRYAIPPGFPFQNIYRGWGIYFDTISFRFAQAAHPTRLVLQRETGEPIILDITSAPQTIPTPDLSRYTVQQISELAQRAIVDIPGKVKFSFDGQCYHQHISGFYRDGIVLPWTLVNYNQFEAEKVNPDFPYAVYYPEGILNYDELLSFEWEVGPGQTERNEEIILDENVGEEDVVATHMIVFGKGGELTVYKLDCEER